MKGEVYMDSLATTQSTGKRRGRKRGHGEGTIDEVPNRPGTWRARLMVDGTRRVVYGKSRGEVQKKLDDLRKRATSGLLGDPKVERGTVAALLTAWLDGKRGTVEE